MPDFLQMCRFSSFLENQWYAFFTAKCCHMRMCVTRCLITGKGAHDLDKEMLTEKIIRNHPFDYTALLEAAENQSEQSI